MRSSDFKNSFKEGDQGENVFRSIALSKGFEFSKSTFNQDCHDHIDCFLEKNGKIASFDVKASKRISRSNTSKTDDSVWIEIYNVQGKHGWLYGKQDCIAFEFSNNFIVVNRQQLADHVSTIIDFKLPYVRSAGEAYYRCYQRKGRQDCITRISKSELLKISHKVWLKN
jgi:hypothetical protein